MDNTPAYEFGIFKYGILEYYFYDSKAADERWTMKEKTAFGRTITLTLTKAVILIADFSEGYLLLFYLLIIFAEQS